MPRNKVMLRNARESQRIYGMSWNDIGTAIECQGIVGKSEFGNDKE